MIGKSAVRGGISAYIAPKLHEVKGRTISGIDRKNEGKDGIDVCMSISIQTAENITASWQT